MSFLFASDFYRGKFEEIINDDKASYVFPIIVCSDPQEQHFYFIGENRQGWLWALINFKERHKDLAANFEGAMKLIAKRGEVFLREDKARPSREWYTPNTVSSMLKEEFPSLRFQEYFLQTI